MLVDSPFLGFSVSPTGLQMRKGCSYIAIGTLAAVRAFLTNADWPKVTALTGAVNVVAVVIDDATAGKVRAKTAVDARADWIVVRIALSPDARVLCNVSGVAEIKREGLAIRRWFRHGFFANLRVGHYASKEECGNGKEGSQLHVGFDSVVCVGKELD